MAVSTSADNLQYIGNTSDGVVIGKTSAYKVAFFGGTPVVQQTAPTAVATTVTVTTTNGYCFTTSTQPAALIDAVNSLITNLSNLALQA